MGNSLPFGRPVNQPDKNKFVDERRRSLPRPDGWVISSLTGGHSYVDAGSVVANTLLLNHIGVLAEDYTLTTAAIEVVTGFAGSVAYSGLFVLDTLQRPNIFRLIPGTSVTFLSDTLGRKEVVLNSPVKVSAGTRVFVSSLVSSTFADYAIAVGTTLERTRTIAATSMPTTVNLSSTDTYDTFLSATTAATLFVMYYSAAASLVI